MSTIENAGTAGGRRRPDGCDPVEAHGRLLTTTAEAAAGYRMAQGASWDASRRLDGLRQAVRADPGFILAGTDLSVLDGRTPAGESTARHGWERHHVEVVAAAARGRLDRAVDLLRDHLSVVGCDPLAVAIVVDVAGPELLADVVGQLLACHRRPITRVDKR